MKFCFILLTFSILLACKNDESSDQSEFISPMTAENIEATITQLDMLISDAKSKTSTLTAISNESTLDAVNAHNKIYQGISAPNMPPSTTNRATQQPDVNDSSSLAEVNTNLNESVFIIPTISYPPTIVKVPSTITPTPTPSYTSVPSKMLGGGYSYIDDGTGMSVGITLLIVSGRTVNIQYTLKNPTSNKIMKEGYFFVYFEDGSARSYKGLQANIMPGQEVNRSYEWTMPIQRKAIRVVYGGDHSEYSPVKGNLSWDVIR